MRKLLILPIIMAFCVADSGAFAATARGGRTGATAGAAVATKKPVARAATSSAAGISTKTTGGVAARAAKKTGVTTTGAKKASPAKSTGAGSSTKTARAAATQKVLNMGTKVKTATENTVVDEECQNAYYGCMDAFCMLDNASGGRCQCSDRNKELDAVLNEIMKLDEQSLAMATEGVERIQMGENVDEIMKRAKAAADGVGKENLQVNIKDSNSGSSSSGSKARQLDLSAWKNNSIFSEDDDVFGGGDEESAGIPEGGEFANKFGDELQIAASGVCVKQLPDQCKKSASFLQLTYGQRIRSDCTAYENSLKQQRAASQEKLATAQKALRDAALESFQNENKYDFGECVVRFKQCLQTTAECGEDYSGCVADTAILSELYGKGKGKGKGVETKDIKTGATTITISAATFDIFNNKKMMCTSVVKQCVNANKKDAVWQQVIKDLAPVIYTAEYNAASNSRMNCISTVAKCVQKACGSQWDEKSDNYDACLSDPNSIDNYCGLEYKRCGDEGTQGNVRDYVMAKLAALKVDKCTTDVKACLLSEDRCGPDYTGCIGLDSDSIVDLCPEDKLISCQDRGGSVAVREYIAQVAQGLALNIDNKFATACQNAVEAAYDKVCQGGAVGTEAAGDEDGSVGGSICPAVDLDFRALQKGLEFSFMDEDDTANPVYDTLEQYRRQKGLSIDKGNLNQIFKLKVIPRGKLLVDRIEFDESGKAGGKTDAFGTYFYVDGKAAIEAARDPKNKDFDGNDGDLETLLKEMASKYLGIMEQIEKDTSVSNCLNGRTLDGISSTSTRGNKATKQQKAAETVVEQIGAEKGRFPKLTQSTRYNIAYLLMNEVQAQYRKKTKEFDDTPAKKYGEILDYFMKEVDAKDAELDSMNERICKAKAAKPSFGSACGKRTDYGFETEYNASANTCVVTRKTFNCNRYNNCCWLCSAWGCRSWPSYSTPNATSSAQFKMTYIDQDGVVHKAEDVSVWGLSF